MKVVDSLRPGERSINDGENWKPSFSIINVATEKRTGCGRSTIADAPTKKAMAEWECDPCPHVGIPDPAKLKTDEALFKLW
jgi:hypothetical protein